jgi:hypothetical protein
MPSIGDLRYQWIDWMAVLEYQEMCELITDAWRMCLPKRLQRPCSDRAQKGRQVGQRRGFGQSGVVVLLITTGEPPQTGSRFIAILLIMVWRSRAFGLASWVNESE